LPSEAVIAMPASAASAGHKRLRRSGIRIASSPHPNPLPEFGAMECLSRFTPSRFPFLAPILVVMRYVVLVFVAFILFSLFSALFFLLKDKGNSTRTAKALTVRVILSITLFVLLLLGFHFGFITQRL
jgi:hypothetical protein